MCRSCMRKFVIDNLIQVQQHFAILAMTISMFIIDFLKSNDYYFQSVIIQKILGRDFL